MPSPLVSKGLGADGYYAAAQQLGGCNADSKRPLVSSVGVTYAQHDLAKTLCAYGAAVVPPGFDTADASQQNLERGAAHLVSRLLSRDATDGDKNALTGDMAGCLAAGPDKGCASAEIAVRWMCVRLVDSAVFSLY